MNIAQEQSIRCSRQRGGHHQSKRRASRDLMAKESKLQGKMNSTLNSNDGDAKMGAEAEALILKQPAAKMVVKPMASTAYMSDSEEGAMNIAQEQSMRFIRDKMTLEEAKGSKSEDSATELEILGKRRKPPHLYRRSSWDSRPWQEDRWYKESDKVTWSSKEEMDLVMDKFLQFLNTGREMLEEMTSTLNASDGDAKAEAMIWQPPAATDLDPQN